MLGFHYVKSVEIRIFFWSVFSCIHSEYRKIPTTKNSYLDTFHAVPLFCYLKSSYFSPDSNHSFYLPFSSRIALVEASHYQYAYFLCPPPSHHHFNIRISFLFLFNRHFFLICFRTFLLILTFSNRFYQSFTVFHVHIIPFFVKL